MGSLIAIETKSAFAVKAVLGHDDIGTSMQYIHDAEQSVAQGVDTLGLAGSNVFAEAVKVHQKPLLLDDGTLVVSDDTVIIEQDLTGDLFPDIADGTKVRPLLKDTDLRLMRKVMVEFARANKGTREMYEAKALLERMLRKVKVSVY